ncbi:MAG: hypothetical protein FJX00_03500 [Alphaproteobacteria bacterium]|nr:hypothetical protein [Alphaproteobacteria bacterium]
MKKLTAIFLSVILFGTLNTVHCVERNNAPNNNTEHVIPNTEHVILNGGKKGGDQQNQGTDDAHTNVKTLDLNLDAEANPNAAFNLHAPNNNTEHVIPNTEPVIPNAANFNPNGGEKGGDQQNQGTDGAHTNVNALAFNPNAKDLNPNAHNTKTHTDIKLTKDTHQRIANRVAGFLDNIWRRMRYDKKQNKIDKIYNHISNGNTVNLFGGRVKQHMLSPRVTGLGYRKPETLHITLPQDLAGRHFTDRLRGYFRVYYDRNNNGLQIVIPKKRSPTRNALHINVLKFIGDNDACELDQILNNGSFDICIDIDVNGTVQSTTPSQQSTYLNHQNHQRQRGYQGGRIPRGIPRFLMGKRVKLIKKM